MPQSARPPFRFTGAEIDLTPDVGKPPQYSQKGINQRLVELIEEQQRRGAE